MRYFRLAQSGRWEQKKNMTLLWLIRNNHIVLNCRCGHVGIIAVQELIDVLGEDMLSWMCLSVLRGAAAAGLSEYPTCKSFT